MKGKCTNCSEIIEIENEKLDELVCPNCHQTIDTADAIFLFNNPKNEVEICPNEVVAIENEEEKQRRKKKKILFSVRFTGRFT